MVPHLTRLAASPCGKARRGAIVVAGRGGQTVRLLSCAALGGSGQRPGFALHSIAATPLQTGANAVFRALNPLLFLMPRVFSSPRLAPHIPESQVDCGGHSEICGPRFSAANCPFPQEKRWTERQGTRTQANSQSRWPRFKHETVCRCRALSLPDRLPLTRSAKALWRLSRDSPSAHHPEAAGQCSSCSVCSRRSTSGRAMA